MNDLKTRKGIFIMRLIQEVDYQTNSATIAHFRIFRAKYERLLLTTLWQQGGEGAAKFGLNRCSCEWRLTQSFAANIVFSFKTDFSFVAKNKIVLLFSLSAICSL